MYSFLGKPIVYWLGLKLLADENNINEDLLKKYYETKVELGYIKETLSKINKGWKSHG